MFIKHWPLQHADDHLFQKPEAVMLVFFYACARILYQTSFVGLFATTSYILAHYCRWHGLLSAMPRKIFESRFAPILYPSYYNNCLITLREKLQNQYKSADLIPKQFSLLFDLLPIQLSFANLIGFLCGVITLIKASCGLLKISSTVVIAQANLRQRSKTVLRIH